MAARGKKAQLALFNLNAIPVQVAGLLIEELSASLADRECGFDDGNYFSRCFRNVMGRSPRGYRKSRSSHVNPKSLAY